MAKLFSVILVVQLFNHVWLSVTPRTIAHQGFPVLHYFPEFAQTHVHWVDDAIQPSHLGKLCHTFSSQFVCIIIVEIYLHEYLLNYFSVSICQMPQNKGTKFAVTAFYFEHFIAIFGMSASYMKKIKYNPEFMLTWFSFF